MAREASGIQRSSSFSSARCPPSTGWAPPEPTSLTDILSFLQNLTTAAFVVLGLAVAISWARHRDRTQGFLALAIVLLSLVARGLPVVQAWRLRSLSLGFAGIVGILVFAIGVSLVAVSGNQAVQLVVQLVVLATVPLLYVSFAPPSWLRREWRASEEEGLRAFMEELLLSEDQDALANRALEWAMRLVGGAAAASFDTAGTLRSSHGFPPDQLSDLKEGVGHLGEGV